MTATIPDRIELQRLSLIKLLLLLLCLEIRWRSRLNIVLAMFAEQSDHGDRSGVYSVDW